MISGRCESASTWYIRANESQVSILYIIMIDVRVPYITCYIRANESQVSILYINMIDVGVP